MTGGASPGPVPRAELRVWGDAACRKVHDATCRVLAETGIEVRHPRALELLRRAGAQVSGTRARLPRDLVDQAVASAPRSFVLHGRAADGSLDLELATASPGTAPGPTAFTWPTSDDGRRRARLADVEPYAGSPKPSPTSTSSCRWVCPTTPTPSASTWLSSPPCWPARASRSSSRARSAAPRCV